MNVTFTLSLKDLVSGGIRKMGTATRSVFGGIDRNVSTTQMRILGLGNAAARMNAPFRMGGSGAAAAIRGIGHAAEEASRDVQHLNREIDKANRKRSGGGGIGFGGIAKGAFVGGLAVQGVMMGVRAAGKQMSDMIGGGMEAGAMREQFKVLAGEQQGAKLYSDIKKYVAESVFGPELYGNARTMMAFGIDSKEVMGDLKMLGDVSMGNKEKMDLLTLAFSQTRSAGKLMGQDLLQYINAGFNPLMVLAEKTGQKYDVLKDKMSKGLVSSDMVKQAFVLATTEGGKFHDMLNKMGDTPFGKKEALIGSFADAKVSGGEAMAPAMGRLFDALKPLVDALPAKLEKLGLFAEKVVDSFTDLLPTLQDFGGMLFDLLAPVFDLALSEEMNSLKKSVVTLATELGEGLVPVVRLLATTLKPIASILSEGLNDFNFKLRMFNFSIAALTAPDRNPESTPKNLTKWEKDYLFNGWLSGKPVQVPFAQIGGKKGDSSNNSLKGATPATVPPTDAITGGGKKVININLNAPVIGKQEFSVSNMKEALEIGIQEFTERYLRVLQGANAAL